MNRKKTVLVTGLGGNVGQGIIRNIKATNFDIRVVGTNIIDFSAGNHLCDVFYKIPYAYDSEFIPTIEKIIKEQSVDLILPSTDYEAYYLSRNVNHLSSKIVVSSAATTAIYLDKYETYLHHKSHGIPFAEACLPSEYKGGFEEFIVKPKKGRGSRGLHFNPKEISGFSDEEYMVQELHRGIEVTTAFYVTKEKKILGHITLERTLTNGATSECRVVKQYDEAITGILEKLIQYSDIQGSANIQSIVTDQGEIHPFEVNCRISGTNSIRSQFGFEDVKYALQEYLYSESPDIPIVKTGVAVRILMDVIYPKATEFKDLSDNSNEHYLF